MASIVKGRHPIKELVEKANVLIEALPYIRNFYGKTFVIKYGGAAQTDENLKHTFAKDVVLLDLIGIQTVIVHGGGPRISSTMEKMGKKADFVHGYRVTDEETMDIVEMVLGGLVNKQIVSLINGHGGRAVGLSGKDGGLIRARKKKIKISGSKKAGQIDIGLVGEVLSIDPEVIISLDRSGFIPVISPVGVGYDGMTYNINADDVAASVASALKAEKLIYLTDVEGVKDKKGKIMGSLTRTQARRLMASKTIVGGMIPKVQAALNSIEEGVSKVHIIDGRVSHCLLLEIFTRTGIGTEIIGARK